MINPQISAIKPGWVMMTQPSLKPKFNRSLTAQTMHSIICCGAVGKPSGVAGSMLETVQATL